MKAAIIIPTYQPSMALLDLIAELQQGLRSVEFVKTIIDIIVVNDGSDNQGSVQVFEQLNSEGVTVIHHSDNMGKGAALKTGIKESMARNADLIVTADADGQHLAKDILNVLEKTAREKKFVLGVRGFTGKVPLRSRIGNSVTSWIFRLLFGQKIIDTQTGLRGIPKEMFPLLCAIKSNRYEFEFEMLINVVRRFELVQTEIETVYQNGNSESHFRPLKDSASIYFVLIRYSSVALTVTALDLSLFYLLSLTWGNAATFIIVRALTTIVYFHLMKTFVFKAAGQVSWQVIKMLPLLLLNALVAKWMMSGLDFEVGYIALLYYILASALMFVLNFCVQKFIIFKK